MTPTEYIEQHGEEKDIQALETILADYIASRKGTVESILKVCQPADIKAYAFVNLFELECRIGREALERWREEAR